MISRKFVRDAFENPASRSFTVVNDLLAFATVVSVVAIVLETVAVFAPYHNFFKAIEYTSVALFSLEYLGRVWTTKPKMSYIFSFFGIIDLLAIVPTYISLANLTFLKGARALRILRFLRMLRLAKLARMRNKEKGAHSLYFLNIQIYATALFIAVLTLGTLLYFFEGDKTYAKNIPTAMLWSFKAILGGIQYDQPTTAAGITILAGARFVSMILLGLLLGLFGTMMRKVLTGSEKDA